MLLIRLPMTLFIYFYYLFIWLLQLSQRNQEISKQKQIMTKQAQLPAKITPQQIYTVFQKYGYQSESMINQQKMKAVLSTQYTRCTGRRINEQLIKQIWNQSEATSKGQISISTIDILKRRILALRGDSGMIEELRTEIKRDGELLDLQIEVGNNQKQKINQTTKEYVNKKLQLKQFQTDLVAFTEYYQTISAIFGNQNLVLNQFHQANTQYINPHDASRFTPALLAHSYSSVKLPEMQTRKQKSGRLLTLFHLTNALIFIQFFIMSSARISMFPITSYLYSLFILILGFKQNFVNYLLAQYIFTLLADIAFLILKMLNRFQFVPYQHSSYSVYVFVLHIFLAVTIVLRLLSIFLYLGFRNAHKGGIHYFFPIMSLNLPLQQVHEIMTHQNGTTYNQPVQINKQIILPPGLTINQPRKQDISYVEAYSATPHNIPEKNRNSNIMNQQFPSYGIGNNKIIEQNYISPRRKMIKEETFQL